MKFDYLVRDQKGELQSGTIEASTEAAAINALQERQLVIIRLQSQEKTSFLNKELKFLKRVKPKEVFLFFRELSILIDAGVPLVESLRALHSQVRNEYLKEVILEIINDVDGGMAFSKALAKHPKVFSSFAVNLMKAAEVSGRLQESLVYLADHTEREYYLVSNIRRAMIYPAFVLGAFTVVAVLVLVMVIPQLTSILKEANQELPWSTKVVIWSSDLLRNWGWLFFLVLVGGVIFGWRYTRTEKGKFWLDKLKLKIPIFGKIFQETYLARLSDSLQALLKGGVSVIQSLGISADVVGSVFLKEILLSIRDEVKIGKGISPSLRKYEVFPPLFSQMVETGEGTGKLDEILERVSKFYSKEVENKVNNLTQLIEPLLIVFLGIGVTILVFSVFMPIYNLAGAF